MYKAGKHVHIEEMEAAVANSWSAIMAACGSTQSDRSCHTVNIPVQTATKT
jgi:hypothetical protein